ncbi:MAG: dihydroorotate dehydrogenase electron transfer subunit [Planctomycetota bacterium]|jgi:dihydroorotate dehydrogenase electron transfer subunit
MHNETEKPKGNFTAEICSNHQVGPKFYRLGLEFSDRAAKIFADAKAGQFLELDLSSAALPPAEVIPAELADACRRKILLRRPFSFFNVAADGERTTLDILYCALGAGTLRMTTLSKGDSISVIGPLGNGFCMPQGKQTALLVVGGMGAPPLLHLAETLVRDYPGIRIIVFAGAKTKEELLFETQLDRPAAEKIKHITATDDGSAGYHGFITDCFTKWLKENLVTADETIIYSCGPEEMLAKVAQTAKEKNIDCQISMERLMACGIGLCQSCAVECRVEGEDETVYKLCCKDGPVFDTKEVIFKL